MEAQTETRPDGRPIKEGLAGLWLLLGLFIVVFIALGTLERQAAQQPEPAESGGLEEDPAMRLTARYVLGAVRLARSADAADQATVEDLLESLEATVATDVQRVRMIPLVAELRDTDAAVRRIEEVRRTLPPTSGAEPLVRDLDTIERIYQEGADSLSERERERLLERHKWYAQLALRQGGAEEAGGVDWAILRTAVLLAVFAIGLLLAGASGFVLLASASIMAYKGALPMRYQRPGEAHPRLARSLLEAVVIFMPLVIILSIVGDLLGSVLGVPVSWLVLWAALAAPLWPLRRGLPEDHLRSSLGWHSGRGLFTEMASGVAGYLAGLPIIFLGLLLTLLIAQLTDSQPAHPAAMQMLRGSVWEIAQLYILACLWAPVMEESIFRGALFSHLRLRFSGIPSALLTGLIFAAIHPQGLAALPVLGAIGTVLALLREWRGSLIPCITAHALNNFAALTLVLVLLR